MFSKCSKRFFPKNVLSVIMLRKDVIISFFLMLKKKIIGYMNIIGTFHFINIMRELLFNVL